MLRFIVLISLLLQTHSVLGQQDSSLTASVVIYHTRDIDVVSKVPVNYTIGLLQISKRSHTIVGYMGYKSNSSINGTQVGLDYYKKGSEGYFHLGIKSSTATFYPMISLEGNYYRTVSKGLEIGIGYKYLTYDTNDLSHTLVASGFYYTGNWMMSYRGAFFDYERLYHYGAARYIFSDDSTFIEANMSNGGEVITNLSQNELLVSSTSYGVKVNGSLWNKCDVFASYNLVYTSQSDRTKMYDSFSIGVKVEM